MRSDSLVTLLEELSPETDLARLIERQRDPRGWARVSEWLAAKGITIVEA